LSTGPLTGLVVLDLTRILSGPFCTMILADFGARVIKVESPGKGDDSRLIGPYVKDQSAYFMSVNRGKQSMTLNLKNPEGRALLKELAARADILVENYRPGTMDQWGLGYEVLQKINPRLIYTSISGFGHSGPYMRNPAYDIVVQGMSGLMSITGQEGGPPTRVGTSVGDLVPALFATVGILLALFSRTLSGEGQRLDVAMLDGLVAILENAIARYQVSGEVPKPIGSRHPSITPFDAFAVKDGHIIVAAGNPKLFEDLCRVLGRPELAQDPRFKEYADRHQNEKALKPLLEQALARFTQNEALDKLGQAGIPCAPINTVDKVMADPQVQAREMIVEVEHPVAGILKLAGIPIKMSTTPGSIKDPAPTLGQHTDHILGEFLGKTAEEIGALRRAKVI
jgi:CoA:oxalate CoA-transferase